MKCKHSMDKIKQIGTIFENNDIHRIKCYINVVLPEWKPFIKIVSVRCKAKAIYPKKLLITVFLYHYCYNSYLKCFMNKIRWVCNIKNTEKS